MVILGDDNKTGLVFTFKLLVLPVSEPLIVEVGATGVDGEDNVMLGEVFIVGLAFTFRVLSTPCAGSFFVSGEPTEGLIALPVFIGI